jgi:uncharacterized protein (DUF697 family)
MNIPLKAGPLIALMREIRGERYDLPIMVGGSLADQLAHELTAGGDPSAVVLGDDPRGVEAFVYVIGDSVTEEDERILKRAHRAKVPTLVVAAGRQVPWRVPFVLATDVIRVEPGHGFSADDVARALARKLGEEAASVARRLPALRPAASAELIERFSRRNGIIGAAVFIPGVDMPVLTLNQVRLVLRLSAMHGLEIDNRRAPELLATVGAGFGFRAVARELLNLIPFLGWAVKGGVAYGGTRAIGEATLRYSRAQATQPQPGSASASSF